MVSDQQTDNAMERLDVIFGDDASAAPDGSVLYLAQMEPDAVGDILVDALHPSPVNIIADHAPKGSGQMEGGDGSVYSYVQFDGVRLLSETELTVHVMLDG